MVDINNEKCCTCTTPEITIKLNKQGPQGLTGPKGEDGFSPIINVGEDTYSTYTLNITDANGTFTTPNLKASLPLGGVEGDVLMKNSSIDGDVSFKTLPSASADEAGIIKLATLSDFAIDPEDGGMVDGGYTDAVTPNVMVEYLQGGYQPKGDYVTVDTEQLVTGRKTFQNRIITNGGIYHSVSPASSSYGEILQYKDDERLILGNKFDKLNINFSDRVQFYNGYANSRRDITINGGLDTPRQEVLQVNYGKDIYNVITEADVATTTTLGLVKPDGDTITIDPDGTIHGRAGGGSSTSDKYGIRGDYSTHFGILDCPNGLIDYNATGKDIVLNAGIVLQLAGQDTKTTIASSMRKTLTSTENITLFYGGGELLEVGKVDYSVEEPEDNGVDNYQAWYNPNTTINPDKKWQFKSNATGNVWRELIATPIANIYINGSNITRIDYIGYRVLDDDIIAQQSDIDSLQEIISVLQQTVATLESRVEALETEINGGKA